MTVELGLKPGHLSKFFWRTLTEISGERTRTIPPMGVNRAISTTILRHGLAN
jgi:hypothetical protein